MYYFTAGSDGGVSAKREYEFEAAATSVDDSRLPEIGDIMVCYPAMPGQTLL